MEPSYHFCKFFIKCSADSEQITLENLEPDEGFLVEARFFNQEQLERLTVYPEALKAQFWEDLSAGFPKTRYLGLEKIAF